MSTNKQTTSIAVAEIYEVAAQKAAALSEALVANVKEAIDSGDRKQYVLHAVAAQAAIGIFTINNVRALRSAGLLPDDLSEALIASLEHSAKAVCSQLAEYFGLIRQEPTGSSDADESKPDASPQA